MSELFLQNDVATMLHNKFVVIMGSSVQRSMYKDLVKMLKKDMYLTDQELRAKGEPKFEDDRLIEGGILNNNLSYREVREYQTNFHLIRFYFITKSYNKYVESVLETFKSEPKPDVLLLNSCLWDITRYGLGPESVEGYRQSLHKLMKKLKTVLDPNCLVLWNSTLPVDKEAKGGVFVPEVESAKTQLGAKILACNLIAHNIVKQYDYDYIDLHYYLRYHLHRRAEDGVHWDMTAHRRMSNLTLFQIAEAWGLKKSEPILSPVETPHGEIAAQVTPSNEASDSVVYVASSPVETSRLAKPFSPRALTKALHTVAKTTKSSSSLTNTAQKSVPTTVSTTTTTGATTKKPVVAASMSKAVANNLKSTAKPAAVTLTTTSVAKPTPHPSMSMSSIGPIKTKKKNKRKKQNTVLNNQENPSTGQKSNDSGPHPYNRPLSLKSQANSNQQKHPFSGPPNQQRPPFNGPTNQQRLPFNGPTHKQKPSFNDPTHQQKPPFNGPTHQKKPPGLPNQQYHERSQFNGPPKQQRSMHYDHYNIQHIENNLNQMNNAVNNNFNVDFGNYDFTKDVDYNDGNFQADGPHQHHGYEWHEYPQNNGELNVHNNLAMTTKRYKPYSRYQANRELYGGSRFQH